MQQIEKILSTGLYGLFTLRRKREVFALVLAILYLMKKISGS